MTQATTFCSAVNAMMAYQTALAAYDAHIEQVDPADGLVAYQFPDGSRAVVSAESGRVQARELSPLEGTQ